MRPSIFSSRLVSIILVLFFLSLIPAFSSTETDRAVDAWMTVGEDNALRHEVKVYPDLSSDINWTDTGGEWDPNANIYDATFNGVADIQAAFNNARGTENGQLGTALPSISMPSQSGWDGLSGGEKALWLINTERVARGLDPLYGLESNVSSVALQYAIWLLDNNKFGHYEDGKSPQERMKENAVIAACNSGTFGENLAVFVASGTSTIDLPVERSVYNWMYDDSGSSWGHRQIILSENFNDRDGDGKGSLLGIGHADKANYFIFGQTWDKADMIVMDVFDPCSTFDYSSVTTSWPMTVDGGGGDGGGGGGGGGGGDDGDGGGGVVWFVDPGQLINLSITVSPIPTISAGYYFYCFVSLPSGSMWSIWNNYVWWFDGPVGWIPGVPNGYSGTVYNGRAPSISGTYTFEAVLIPRNLPQTRANATVYSRVSIVVR
jgi:uncharacterized protein YkwD